MDLTLVIGNKNYSSWSLRFQAYEVSVDDAAGEYLRTLLALPALQEWITAAYAEKESIPQYEPADA
jgi:glutathione S-transferase